MEQANNIFTNGLNTDLHPLTTSENLLVDALNATTITFNGNEFLLQNDMGNTLIKDSKTGNIVGLNEGFIPVGIKEHGGILYIASLNPKTGKGELGSIPSPKINYTYYPTEYNNIETTLVEQLKENSNDGNISNLYGALNSEMIIINEDLFSCGDQFIAVLDLSKELDKIYTRIGKLNNDSNFKNYEYPVLTKLFFENGEYKKLYGWYNVCLYALVSGKQPIRLTEIENSPQIYYIKNQKDEIVSPYWFILKDDLKNNQLDINKCQEHGSINSNIYRKYPNIMNGKLAIKLELNIPENISMLINTSTGLNTPFTFCKKTKN